MARPLLVIADGHGPCVGRESIADVCIVLKQTKGYLEMYMCRELY